MLLNEDPNTNDLFAKNAKMTEKSQDILLESIKFSFTVFLRNAKTIILIKLVNIPVIIYNVNFLIF